MLDISIAKTLVILGVGLIVIGPKNLPATAKAIGILWARGQIYLNKLKSEVNQHINLDEMKELHSNLQNSQHQIMQNLNQGLVENLNDINNIYETENYASTNYDTNNTNIRINNGRNSWRIKKSTLPIWYKQKNNLRVRIQHGAARMQRFRYNKKSSNYFNF